MSQDHIMSQKGKEKCWISPKSVSPRGTKQCTRSRGGRRLSDSSPLSLDLWLDYFRLHSAFILISSGPLELPGNSNWSKNTYSQSHVCRKMPQCSSSHTSGLSLSGWFHTSAVSPYRGSVLLWAEARRLSALLLSQDLVGQHSYLLSPRVSTAKSTTELGWASHPLLVVCFHTSVSHVWASQYTP